MTDIDVIESFTLVGAGGDLPIEEASIAWKDKSIIANLPASLCFKEKKIVQDYVRALLSKVLPRKNFMLEVSEDMPYPQWKRILPYIAEIIQNQ